MQFKVLTSLQSDVLYHFFQNEWGKEDYFLSGGTALSEFYLQHRYSDDLDFFTPRRSFSDADKKNIAKFFQSLNLDVETTQIGETFLRFFVSRRDEEELKLKTEFCTDPHPKMDRTKTFGDIRVDSLEDIAVNKVCCIVSRSPIEPKDVYDLYCILNNTHFLLDVLLVRAREKDATFEDEFGKLVFAQNLLAYCRKTQKEEKPLIPRMIHTISHTNIVEYFEELSRAIIERLRPNKK